MNEDPAFLRVRVRREVLPALEAAAGPAASRALARFAALAAEDDAYLHEQAARAWARVRWPDGSLEAGAVRALERPLRRRVLARLIEEAHLPVDAALVDDALEALDEGRVQTLPGDCLLDGGADRLIVTAAPPRALHPSSRSAPGRGAG